MQGCGLEMFNCPEWGLGQADDEIKNCPPALPRFRDLPALPNMRRKKCREEKMTHARTHPRELVLRLWYVHVVYLGAEVSSSPRPFGLGDWSSDRSIGLIWAGFDAFD